MCVDVVDRDQAERSRGSNELVRVAVAGLGTIGEGAALRLLSESNQYALCAALVKDASKRREQLPDALTVTDDAAALFATKPDVIIDALPSGEAGLALIKQALARGVGVVSANKQALAGSLDRLVQLGTSNGASLRYSAAVGGGSPMVETVRDARGSGEVSEITAILNGTVNYILTALSEGGTFADSVRKAQEAGFAEPDPTADLSGDDARAKISILAYEAFGEEVDLAAVHTEALTADRAAAIVAEGGAWKQLSRIKKHQDGAVTANLGFEKVASENFFADVRAEGNALQVVLASGDAFSCAGKGAGRAPTVDSLFADLAGFVPAIPTSESA